MADQVHELWHNRLLRNQHAQHRSMILEQIAPLKSCHHGHFLSLAQYFQSSPARFFCNHTYNAFAGFLEAQHSCNRSQLEQYMADNHHRLDQALFFLSEINCYQWHDSLPSLDDYERLRFIDQEIHPAYLRTLEAVLYPFLHMIAFFSRCVRGKGCDDLDLFNVIQELRRTPFAFLQHVYNNVVRNGIGHGGVTYLQDEIRYEDKKGNTETLWGRDMVRLFDDLLDVCNGLALGFRVFALCHLGEGYTVPQHLLLEELQAETRSPWWNIEGCVPQDLGDRTQLLIYAQTNTSDYERVQFSGFTSAVFAEMFLPGYDRYFLSIKSSKALPGWAAFDGRRIKMVRSLGPSSFGDYVGILEDGLLVYAPRIRVPRAIRRWETLLRSIQIHGAMAIVDFRIHMGLPHITIRDTSIHRSGAWAVVGGVVVVDSPSDKPITKDLVRRSRRRVIRDAIIAARRSAGVLSLARRLPVGFVQIEVFSTDYRKRRLCSFGLGPDLICTIRVQRLSRIRSPDIPGSDIQVIGPYRIAWNRAWLEANPDA